MRRLLIVADHPSLHRGFSTVGHHIATGLQRTGRWVVEYIGRYTPASEKHELPYRVFDADLEVKRQSEDDDSVAELVLARTEDLYSGGPRRPLLSIGTVRDQRLLLDQVDRLGIREKILFLAYMPIDSAPLAPQLGNLLRRVDMVVPFTSFASRTVRKLCDAPNAPIVSEPISHGVDTSVFRSPDSDARRDFRQRFFGVDEESPLIGFFGRNSGHKHPDLALRIFDMFARGKYVRCRNCCRITPFDSDPIDGSGCAPPACAQCGSGDLGQGEGNGAARLYMHTEILSRLERSYSGGWDLDLLAARLGINDQVIFDRSLRIGEGLPVTELARRMGACDVHLLPFDHAGWELTVLETAACGVPNVITDFAAPPEYAASFSELVPLAVQLFGPDGTRGIINLGQAIEALLRLVNDRDHRCRLSRHGVEVAKAHCWEGVVRAWDQLLSAAVSDTGVFQGDLRP